METYLRELRKARGLTQAKLAEKSGVSRVLIAKYEIGDICPGAKTLLKLSDALDVSTDSILKNPADINDKNDSQD